MGRKLLVFIILIALIFVGYTKYIQMDTMEKGLESRWSLLESEYQHKSDVIFSLSKNISTGLEDQYPVFDSLRQVRNAVAMVKIDTDNFTVESLDQFREAYQELLHLQGRLVALGREHPEISNNQEYRELIAELEGTELRIANERRRFNEQVVLYNKYVNGFFNLAISQVFGFKDWPEFTPILGE